MSDSRFDPRFDPAFQRGWDGPAPTAAPAQEPDSAVPQGRLLVTAQPEPDVEHEHGPDARRLNPFLIALAAIAVALVVAGLWMASVVSSGFNDQGPATQVDWALLQVLMYAAPVTSLLGVATGIGVLFVFAVRWGRD